MDQYGEIEFDDRSGNECAWMIDICILDIRPYIRTYKEKCF